MPHPPSPPILTLYDKVILPEAQIAESVLSAREGLFYCMHIHVAGSSK